MGFVVALPQQIPSKEENFESPVISTKGRNLESFTGQQ